MKFWRRGRQIFRQRAGPPKGQSGARRGRSRRRNLPARSIDQADATLERRTRSCVSSASSIFRGDALNRGIRDPAISCAYCRREKETKKTLRKKMTSGDTGTFRARDLTPRTMPGHRRHLSEEIQQPEDSCLAEAKIAERLRRNGRRSW